MDRGRFRWVAISEVKYPQNICNIPQNDKEKANERKELNPPHRVQRPLLLFDGQSAYGDAESAREAPTEIYEHAGESEKVGDVEDYVRKPDHSSRSHYHSANKRYVSEYEIHESNSHAAVEKHVRVEYVCSGPLLQ
eukprot:791055_1